jgi:hypothetical protein
MLAAVRNGAGPARDGDPAVRPWVLALRRLLGLTALTIGATIGFLLLTEPAHADSGGSAQPAVRPVNVHVQPPSSLVNASGGLGQGWPTPDLRSAPATGGDRHTAGAVSSAARQTAPVPLLASRTIPGVASGRLVGTAVAHVARPALLPIRRPLLPIIGPAVPIVGPALALLTSVGGGVVVLPSAPAFGVRVRCGVPVGGAAGARSDSAKYGRDDRAAAAVSHRAPVDGPADPPHPFTPGLRLGCAATGSAPGLHLAAGYLTTGSVACNGVSTRPLKTGDTHPSKLAIRPLTRPD